MWFLVTMGRFKQGHEGCQAALVKHCYNQLQRYAACEKPIEIMVHIVAMCILAFVYENISYYV